MKKPNGCKTPTKDREVYNLTASDISFMLKNAKNIWNMIVYYSNMPENKTGEIEMNSARNEQKFDELCETITDIKEALVEVAFHF